jgi:hypothetical protein
MDLIILLPLLIMLGVLWYITARRKQKLGESTESTVHSQSAAAGRRTPLFGSKKPPDSFRERKFTMPCTPREAMSVIASTTDHEGDRPFGALIDDYLAAKDRGEIVGKPPLVESIFIESMSDTALTIAAGNRVATLWRMQLILHGANPVNGSFGATEINNTKWMGNVLKMNSALRRAVESVGGKTVDWPSFV